MTLDDQPSGFKGTTMMREGTVAEFEKARNKSNQPPRYMHTKRTMDVEYKDRGTTVASKHQVLTRGLVSSEIYMVNPDYI